MLRRVFKLVLAMVVALLGSHFTASQATALFGSESPDIYLVTVMVRSDDGSDCVIYFLQERSLSGEGRCEETNHAIKYLFNVKKLDIQSHDEIKRIELNVLEYFVKKSRGRW